MIGDDEGTRGPDDELFAALYREAEHLRLPNEPPYDVGEGLQRFSAWLDEQSGPETNASVAREHGSTQMMSQGQEERKREVAGQSRTGPLLAILEREETWSDEEFLEYPDDRARAAERRESKPAPVGWERRLRRAADRGLVNLIQPTHRARMLPSFLIVGAQRCGTSSLFHVLSQHPATFTPTRKKKELHFFDIEYQRGLAWYQSHFPVRVRARTAARGTGVEPVAFEGSPYYMFHPLAPARIHRDLPGVRLLVLVRDPVERAYSQHAHQVYLGLETEPFERALELEDARIEGEAERLASDPTYTSRNHWLYAYRTRGHYADQLDRLERTFGRDRIHVIDSGDFFDNPGPEYDRVLEFLGLPSLGQAAFTPQNALPRSPMPASLRASLDEHFRPHDERLAAWLGRAPSWRRATWRH